MAHNVSLDDNRGGRISHVNWGLAVLDLAVVLGVGAALAATFALHSVWMLQNHDNDFDLEITRRILAGGAYMRDFVEVNPPLIFLMYIPAVVLAAPLELDGYTAFVLYVCCFIAVSAALSWPVIRWCFRGNPLGGRLFLLAYAGVLCFEPGYDFGQREHFIVILLCPGLFWFAARDMGRPSPITPAALAVILLAAMGLLIKPFYMLVALGMLLLRAGQNRSWRVLLDVPVYLFVAVTLVYAAVIILGFPGFLPEEMVVAQIYFAWNRAWMTVMDGSRDTVAALSLAVVLTELAPVPDRHQTLLRYCGVAGVTCLAMAFIQHKGWPYHYLPAREIALIMLAFVAASLLPTMYRPRTAVLLATITVAVSVLMLRPVEEGLITYPKARFLTRPLIQSLRQIATGDKVMLLTSGFQEGFPSLAEVKVGGRAPGQLLLPGTVKLLAAAHTPAQQARAEAFRHLTIAQAVEDLGHYQPKFVAVDRNKTKQALPDDYDILKFYESDEAFQHAWANYQLAKRIPGWDLYEQIK